MLHINFWQNHDMQLNNFVAYSNIGFSSGPIVPLVVELSHGSPTQGDNDIKIRVDKWVVTSPSLKSTVSPI
jgi:hypothetical protein